jgi:hypothetical protein
MNYYYYNYQQYYDNSNGSKNNINVNNGLLASGGGSTGLGNINTNGYYSTHLATTNDILKKPFINNSTSLVNLNSNAAAAAVTPTTATATNNINNNNTNNNNMSYYENVQMQQHIASLSNKPAPLKNSNNNLNKQLVQVTDRVANLKLRSSSHNNNNIINNAVISGLNHKNFNNYVNLNNGLVSSKKS